MNDCLKSEMEYRAWRECPQWYCLKTTFHNNGSIESELIVDEKTKLPLIIQDAEKPADGVFETATATVYYTYHRGYEEAARQMAVANVGKCS
ncbi:MAG: hypothetical protein RR365_02335 [Bacteroides sp.]